MIVALLQQMVWKLEHKTFRWNFVESVEAPRVVHVEVFDELQKDNVFAQITVRLHTKQVRSQCACTPNRLDHSAPAHQTG